MRKRGLGWYALPPLLLILAIAIGAPFALYRPRHKVALENGARVAADTAVRAAFATGHCPPRHRDWCVVTSRLVAARVTLPSSSAIRDCSAAYNRVNGSVPGDLVFDECAAYPLRQRGQLYSKGLWVIVSPKQPPGEALPGVKPAWVVIDMFLVPIRSLDQPNLVPA